jgi:hypothetical protein
MRHRLTSPLALIAPLCLLLFIASLAHAESPARRPTTARAAEESKFIRFLADDDGDGGALQTSIVTYRNPAGVTVDLVGAVHIADQPYFDGLNKRLGKYDAVLFELVRPKGGGIPGKREAKPDDGNAGNAAAEPRMPRALGWVGMLQRFLRDNLELRFQLEEIDYDRPHFVHADLELEEFLRMQQERGESFAKLMLQTMLRQLSRDPLGTNQPSMAELLMALQAPDRARQLKLVLARQFHQMEEMMSAFEGPDGSVIITERNKAAIKVLKDRIAQGDRRLAVFYGAGHLPGMEKILTTEMGFQQVGDPVWITAWDLTAAATQPTTRPRAVPAR